MNYEGVSMTAIFQNISNCSEMTGVSKDYLYKLCHEGTIPFIRIGKKFMLNFPALMDYLEEECRHVKN